MKYQCYFDGSITVNPGGDMTIGGLVNEVGETKKRIYDFSDKFSAKEFPNGTSNNVAEAMALHKLLSYFELENATHERIEIFGDSQIVINRCIRKKRGGKGIFIPYMDAVVDMLRKFSNISFKWIPRELNTEADSLT
jgi:ribonuclease HI